MVLNPFHTWRSPLMGQTWDRLQGPVWKFSQRLTIHVKRAYVSWMGCVTPIPYSKATHMGVVSIILICGNYEHIVELEVKVTFYEFQLGVSGLVLDYPI